MTHAQKPDFVFRRNGRIHLNRPGGVSSVDYWQPRCAASAVVMLDTSCSEIVRRVLATHCIRQFPLHFPYRASPCAITFQLDSATLRLLPHGPVNISRSLELQCSYILPSLTKHRFIMSLKLCNNYRSIKFKFVGHPVKKKTGS